MRTLIKLLLFQLVISVPLMAQEDKTVFTLDDAITYALENNYDAINASRDLVDAQKQKWETIAVGLPQISGAVSYQNQFQQTEAQFPSILVPEQFLPEGIIQGPDTFVPIIFTQPQQLTATATLTQQIFDGSYIVGVQATKAFLSFSQNNKEKTDLQITKGVVSAYSNVILARASVSIIEKNKANLEDNLLETRKIYENGLTDEESVEQLQITLATIDNQLKNGKRLERITLQMLNLMMGLDINHNTMLAEDLDAIFEESIVFDLAEKELNLENNVDYKLAENLNQQRYFELKLAKSKALPRLNAFLNYGALSFGDSFSFLDNGQEYFAFSTLGVDLNIPIFSSLGRNASTQRAKIALDKAKTQLTQAESQIKLQYEQTKSEYILALERYETSKANLNLAERIEHKNEIKYKEGIATSFELRQAQMQLYSTQQEFLQSMADVINRRTELKGILNED